MGARQLGVVLARNDYHMSRWTAGKMMEYLGIKAIYCKPSTTKAAPENPEYPYLLHNRLTASKLLFVYGVRFAELIGIGRAPTFN